MSQDEAGSISAPDSGRQYARLGVRIRSATYDAMILMVAFVITVTLAVASDSRALIKAIGLFGTLFILLYEPVMLWTKGGTLGHIICNLRVVDDRTFAPPGLAKAIIRFAIKALLGWLSLLTITASRRQRAVHDLLTGTTVQIRHMKENKPYDFTQETFEPIGRRLISFLWRLLSVAIYIFLSLLFLALVFFILIALNILPEDCLNYNNCSIFEAILFNVLNYIWLAILFSITYFGLQGQLFGFRSR